MNRDRVQALTDIFESHARTTASGVEFWLARDIQQLLGYTKWDNFLNVLSKAKTSCEVSGHQVADHFADVGKTIAMPKGAEKEVPDLMLTRYACYLTAQNGDPKKQEIAFAQTYFAVQTRKAGARKKLTETEKELSALIYEQTGGNENFALIRSKGDQALFSLSTQDMKLRWRVPDNRPLADFAPTLILKAKDFATEITIHNAKVHEMATEGEISREHVTNNRSVRETLIERGIHPEKLPPEEDLKKVERRLSSEDKKALKRPDCLEE